MYNHRIIPSGTGETIAHGYDVDSNCSPAAFLKADTIPIISEWTAEQLKVLAEITMEGWDKIIIGYSRMKMDTDGIFERQSPSQYLSELLSLVPLKVEEIKKLSEVKK